MSQIIGRPDHAAPLVDDDKQATYTYRIFFDEIQRIVNENEGAGGGGDMLKSVYDPTGVNGNAFAMSNMAGTTDNLSEGVVNLYNRVPTGGTTGQVLAKITATDFDTQFVDAVAASGSLIKIASGSESNVASVDFLNLLAIYSSYELTFWNLVPVTGSNSMRLRTSNSPTPVSFDSAIADYSDVRFQDKVGGGQVEVSGSNVSTDVRLTMSGAISGMSNVVIEGGSGTLRFIAPAIDTARTHVQFKTGYTSVNGNEALITGSGRRKSSATIGAFQVFMETGNISTMEWVLHGTLA